MDSQEIVQAIEQVQHPEIKNTLVELGMVQDIKVDGEQVSLRLVLPFLGIPAAVRDRAEAQLQEFLQQTEVSVDVVDYRRHIGQFASASGVAAVLAAEIVASGTVPAGLTGSGQDTVCSGSVLILGLGRYITAMECGRS